MKDHREVDKICKEQIKLALSAIRLTIFSNNVLSIDPLSQELARWVEIGNRETGTSHFCRPGGDRK